MEYMIRPVMLKDAKGINDLRRMPGVFETILGIPSEPLQKTESYLAAQDPNTHQFVAVVEHADGTETVIGTAGLQVSPNSRLRHSGGIGMMVHKDYQNQGVGAALLETVLDIADNWLMLVRVELEVFADNAAAIHLYEKHGFQVEGTKRRSAIRHGAYADCHIMARIRE